MVIDQRTGPMKFAPPSEHDTSPRQVAGDSVTLKDGGELVDAAFPLALRRVDELGRQLRDRVGRRDDEMQRAGRLAPVRNHVTHLLPDDERRGVVEHAGRIDGARQERQRQIGDVFGRVGATRR